MIECFSESVVIGYLQSVGGLTLHAYLLLYTPFTL